MNEASIKKLRCKFHKYVSTTLCDTDHRSSLNRFFSSRAKLKRAGREEVAVQLERGREGKAKSRGSQHPARDRSSPARGIL